jgi:hypothetical protein
MNAMASDSAYERARAYVADLVPDCTWTDGYVCVAPVQDDFLDREATARMVPGSILRAWDVCYRDFLAIDDLTEAQKDLRHYRIGFTEDDEHYIVLFSGLLLPYIDADGKPDGVVNAVFGRSVQYRVSKQDLVIRQRLYLP